MASEQQLSEVLVEFARTMATDFPIQAILDRLVERIVEIMPITAAGVTLISPGTVPQYIAASNDDALVFEKLQTELGEGPCLVAYHTGSAVEVPDLRSEERFPRFSPRALEAGMGAVFTFPLYHGENRLGALDLYRDTPGSLSADSLAAAQTLADVATAYLLNAQARDDLQAASDQSRYDALHDALTGLPNRVLMLERLEHAFLRARRSKRMSAVFYVDLDQFKAVNDTYGHHAGDELLVAVAKRLTAVLRPGDTLARLGGDEFVILCEDLNGPSDADGIVARLDSVLIEPFVLSSTLVEVGASVGIAFTGVGVNAPEQLLRNADIAMYRAKRAGGGRHQVLDLREQHFAENEASLERDLRGAVGRGELYLDYQPIVASVDARITGIEVLLRWAHPSRGLVSPSVLIPLAEQSGLILSIGRWVLEQAWTDWARWQDEHPSDRLAVSVNVSAHQFMSSGFVDTVATVLETASTDPELLTLEVTESVFVSDGERALIVLNDLKALGVKLALDDFGTGYSSLSYLKRFPVDTVKVDRAFVSDLGRDPVSHAIVAAVIQLAHALRMTVVAEGVETVEQYRELTSLGCDSCQGFYFARPMSAASLDSLIHHPDKEHARSFPVPATTSI